MFWKLFLHAALFLPGEYICSVFNVATLLLELREHFCAQVCMPYLTGFFCFAIKNESVCFDCSSLLNHRTNCQWGEPEYLHDISSLLFRISVHGCKISNFPFIDGGFHYLPVMVPSDTKWQACWSTQNEWHDANGAIAKGGTRVEWQNSADWPHTGEAVANCFSNFCHI